MIRDFIIRSFTVDDNTFVLACIFAVWAAVITRELADNIVITVFSAPVFLTTILVTYALIPELQLEPTGDKVVNLAFAGGVGMTVVSLVFISISWFWLTVIRR